MRIRHGERIPVDGRVTRGHSAVDLSFVTGEPVPVERSMGDEVIGGSINGDETLLVEVTRIGEESFLAQVVRHVEHARALKPGIRTWSTGCCGSTPPRCSSSRRWLSWPGTPGAR